MRHHLVVIRAVGPGGDLVYQVLRDAQTVRLDIRETDLAMPVVSTYSLDSVLLVVLIGVSVVVDKEDAMKPEERHEELVLAHESLSSIPLKDQMADGYIEFLGTVHDVNEVTHVIALRISIQELIRTHFLPIVYDKYPLFSVVDIKPPLDSPVPSGAWVHRHYRQKLS